MSTRKWVILVVHAAAFVAAVGVAALDSSAADWRPVELVLLLFFLAVGSDILTVEVRGLRVSGAFLAIILAMTLLGPAPAVAIGVVSTMIDGLRARRRWEGAVNDLVNYAVFPLVGGLLIELLAGNGAPDGSGLGFAAAVLLVFMACNFLNFLMVVGFQAVYWGRPLRESVRSIYGAVLPSEFATGLLTAAVAYSYYLVGVAAVWLTAVVLFVFQYLLRAGLQAFERGEELGKRTRELASLQVGLLSTVLQTLSMRDG